MDDREREKASVKSGHSAPMPSGSQEAPPAQVFWMVSPPLCETSESHLCDDSPSSSHCFPKFMQLELSRRLDHRKTPPGERQPLLHFLQRRWSYNTREMDGLASLMHARRQ